MPDNNAKSDIDFQPKTQGYSYSSNGNSSKKYGIYLLIGIILLIVILLTSLFYLNNSRNTKVTPDLQKKTKNTPPANDSKFTNYKKLANQATNIQISNYLGLISEGKIPSGDPKSPEEIYGIFSGFDNNYIQIVTYNGIKNFPYISNLTISKFGKPQLTGTDSATIGLTDIKKGEFFSQSMFGKILHLSITLTSPVTIQQIYLNE